MTNHKDAETRARETLAAEYERRGYDDAADAMRAMGYAGWITPELAMAAIRYADETAYQRGLADMREQAAGVADHWTSQAKDMEKASLVRAKEERSLWGREGELEYAVGYAKRANQSAGIATAIRALATADQHDAGEV